MGSEFVALPGLCLTVDQARRLWGLEPQSCERLLSKLVRRGMLVLTPGGVYRRADRVSTLHADRPHA
jgi:predicted transcriptional regulator of viral defense system